ncbi:MAG: hypothetical protein QF437_27230 [Planctomycetota bacterium]|jgi:hypothetical protein|nr:hypothetical protein [Planctomycetota bacterium]MDP7134222.1 hypothetical protein [Planctomycetota bacterium]MDP7252592.1 hypothetical protein [Planctomycetota bacterium]|tara:strand:+ start:174 stop:410 length:237 start_codon:yes stop_codon:yes gene_type:complete
MSTLAEFEAIDLFTDFLAGHPTDSEILSFKLPERINRRVQELAIKNSAGEITEEELHELKEYERLDIYSGLLKSKVRR